jgi:hypothetical protein
LACWFFGKKFIKPVIRIIDADVHSGMCRTIAVNNRLIRESIALIRNFLVDLYLVDFAVRPCYETIKRRMHPGSSRAFGLNGMKRRRNLTAYLFRR